MSKKRKIFNIIAAVLKYVILIFGALFTLMPFLWMIISSLKTPAEIIAIPPTLLPSSPQWSELYGGMECGSVPKIFLEHDYSHYLFNNRCACNSYTFGFCIFKT